jgi:uncharacterized protein (TIGR02145 family)
MKKLFIVLAVALIALAVSCKKDNTEKNKPDAVDLGIEFTRLDGGGNPVTYKLYWADRNIGASKPDDFGSYYAWGVTETQTNYYYTKYKWMNNQQNFITKYCIHPNAWDGEGEMDNKTVLESGPEGDDVASKQLGGGWRMPTKEEWEQLLAACEISWTGQGSSSGYKLTGKNGESIFIPAAGRWIQEKLDETFYKGYYWSSSLGTSASSNAFALKFEYDTQKMTPKHVVSETYRYIGASIRPVKE